MAFLNQQLLFLEVWKLLRRGSRFRCLLFPVTLVEAINASGSVYQLLLAGKKRVTSRANFHVQVAFSG
jgi:hypothetical protein